MVTKDEVDRTFKYFDADGNGEIEYHEFLQFFRRQDLESVTVYPLDDKMAKPAQKSQRDIKKQLLSQRSQLREKIKRNATLGHGERRASAATRDSTLMRTASDSKVFLGQDEQSSLRRSRSSVNHTRPPDAPDAGGAVPPEAPPETPY